MAQMLVRSLDDDVKRVLARRAARHGRSLEAEAREILRAAAVAEQSKGKLGSAIAARFRGAGLDEAIGELRGPATPAELAP